jgi:hypothetical protein
MHSVAFVTDFSFVLCYESHLVSGEGTMLPTPAFRRVVRPMSMAHVTIAQASFVEFVLPDRFQMDRRM